ncbi:MAG: glutamate--cysteine ligase [Cellvibrionaceae bacterium]|nr:glutamate--cysteine ligase [Cellvibrionaceae bacterium]
MFKLNQMPAALRQTNNAALLCDILRGVERECLRATKRGGISQRAHPARLGASLTHPQITTDFSEALLELITPPSQHLSELMGGLSQIQRFVNQHLEEDEVLWGTSMPCYIESDSSIPVARYGSSNSGKMKTIYRVGLGHRYGRSMQTVAGVHYNFSLPKSFWALLHSQENSTLDLQKFIDEKYFSLIRNFRRHHWLLIYLFGGSPAMDQSFVRGRQHDLQRFAELEHCLYMPYATSLRMGDLGYQSSAQESLFVCYNHCESYIQTLCGAINRKHPDYETIGVLDSQQNYRQLNTHLLQIENEFYSAIRPKRSASPGETALSALSNRGVEYIEVRCLDVDPFHPLGINEQQIRFLDTFLLYCALQTSPQSNYEEFASILDNQKRVVLHGRQPGLMLQHHELGELSLHNWATQLLDALQPVTELLDQAHQSNSYAQALASQLAKVKNSDLTPSAKMLRQLDASGMSLNQFTLQLSRHHAQTLANTPLSAAQSAGLKQMAEASHAAQKSLEELPQMPFNQFLEKYYQQYGKCEEMNSDCA